jgi:hypothetical protein
MPHSLPVFKRYGKGYGVEAPSVHFSAGSLLACRSTLPTNSSTVSSSSVPRSISFRYHFSWDAPRQATSNLLIFLTLEQSLVTGHRSPLTGDHKSSLPLCVSSPTPLPHTDNVYPLSIRHDPSRHFDCFVRLDPIHMVFWQETTAVSPRTQASPNRGQPI